MSDIFNDDESDIALVLAAVVQRSGGVLTIPDSVFEELLGVVGCTVVIDHQSDKQQVVVTLTRKEFGDDKPN